MNEIFPGFPAAWSAWLSPRRFSSSTPTGSTRKRGRGGHGQALVHVGDELGGGALDGGCAGRKRGGGRGGAGRGRGAGPRVTAAAGGRDGGPRRRGAVAVRPLADDAALEQPAPLGTHGRGIPEKFLVHDLGEAGVGRFEHVRIHDVHHPDG